MVAKKTLAGKGIEPEYVPRLVDVGKGEDEPEDEHEPRDQECYQFNDTLPPSQNSKKCRHCKKYLTTQCDRINDFIDEDGEVDDS